MLSWSHYKKGLEKMLTKIDATKGYMEKVGVETEEMLKEHITTQTVESVPEKST
jgi:hypothetical protein